MDYALLPTNPNSSLGDPSLGTLGVSVSLRDVPRPTGPEEEAVFVLVSILDHSDTRVIIGSTEMRHIAGPHLDFVCTVGFHRVLPLDSTADPRKLLFEVFVAAKELLPGGGEPLAPCRLREGSTGVKRVALHITPLFTSLYHGVVSYGLLDSDHPHQGLFSPLRAPLAEHTAEGADAPLPLESKPLGYIQTTALPLTPLAYTLGMVQLKCAFKGFPVRPSGRPSTPYLQVQRKVGQRGDVYVTEPAWCGIPKRSGGRRDPATPPPPGTPPFISDPVTLEIPIVALLEAGSGGMGVRSLRDVRSSITAMVRLEVCDWYGEEESGGGGGGGKDPSFGTLDVRLSELLDPALTSPYLDAVLHREGGGDGPELVVRFFDTVLVPLYNPFPSLLPLPPAPPTPVAPPTQVIKGSGMPGESLQYQQQQQQQQGEGGYVGGVMGVGELAPPLPPPTISSAPTSLPPTKPTLLVPPPLLPPPTDSQREGVEEQVKLKLKEQESHIAGLLEQERQQQKVWQQQQEEQQSALRRAILEQQQLLQQQQQQLLQQQQQLLQASSSNPSLSYGGPSAAATMAYMLAPSYANVTASLQNMPSIASLPPPPPPPASYFASIGSTASSTSAIAAAAAAAAGSGSGAGTSGGTTYRERSTRIHVPPQHPSDTVFISPALLSVSPAITQRLQPGKGSSEQQETINSFIRSSHTAGAQWGGGSESSRVVSTSTPFSSPTPFPSSRTGGGGGGGGGAVATHLGNVTPSSLSSALGVVGSGATSSSSSSSNSSKLSLLDASTILPPPPPAAPLVSPLKLPPPTQLDWGSASKLAQSSITLGATLPSGGGGGGGGSVEILMPPLPLPKSLERGDDSISSGAERRLEALKKGTHTLTSNPPTPAPAATSSTTLLPSSSSFTLPKTAALAQTDFNAKLFTALLKNSDAAAAAAATAAVTSQGGPKNPESSSPSSSLPGDWVVQYMQNLESGALGLAKRPPRDLVVSAAVSLGLTGVLESLEGIVHTTLANDRVVVSEAGAEAQLQRDSELRTAAGRGREAWWKAATAHEWPTSQAPPPPRGGPQPLHLSSTSGGPLTPLADTSVDDVPLSTYHYLKDAATRALGEITTRWPQAAMEAVRAPQDLRDFLRAAATPMSHSREASQSARATALREYDALHAEGLHQGTRRGEAVGAVGVVLGEGEELRREVREKRDTLATALDRVRGLLKEHALGVAEMEGVVWAGEDGHLLLNSPSSSSSDSTTGTSTTPPLSSRIATTGELIALASAPNDATVGKARRLEAAKERVKAHTIAAPVDMYRDLLAATREETERRVRVMGEEAESRYALEIASADTVYRAGQRDAVEVAKASASEAAKAFSESGGGGADVLEAMSRRVVGVMSNSSSSGTARMGHREALETLVWEVEKSRVAQRELGERLQQVQAAITRLHVRQSCSMELTNLKHHCRAYWQNPHTHGIAHPLGIQRFLLQAVKISPYSSLMASFLRARHPPLADRYAQSPHVSMAGHLQNSSPYLSTYPPGAGGVGSGGDPYYAPNAWRPPSAPTPNPPFVNYATPLNPPPGFQNFSRAFGV